MTTKDNITKNTTQFIHRAWMRDGKKIYSGQALLIAMLVHSHGDSREGQDAEVVRKIMKDVNL